MGGTKRFTLDANLSSSGVVGSNEFAQSAFKLLWDHMKRAEVGGVVTEVARNNGNNIFGGSLGTDYYDEPSPFGEHAWSLFRWETSVLRTWTWYMFFSWSTGTFNTAPNSPGRIGGSTGFGTINLGLSAACAVDGVGASLNP